MLKNKSLFFAALALFIVLLTGCASDSTFPDKAVEINGLEFEERVGNKYADQFLIDRYKNGYSLIHIANGEKYLIVPQDGAVPQNLTSSIKIIQSPADNIYLAATAAMDLFVSLGSGGNIRFSGTKISDWYIPYAKEAMLSGSMLYAGKYREPDYELLISNGCRLSVQSTMIDHTPEVKEKLEELGITVFTDYSSYESHPLARCEWIKIYGEMTGKREEAQKLFDEQVDIIKPLENTERANKKVVFFYVSSSGQIIARRPGDYISRMIEIAGGDNILNGIESKDTSSTITMEAEEFYSLCKDADIIIYNTNIGGDLSSLDELAEKYPLIVDFKAFKNGNVWCTKNNLFQETMKTAEIISDFHNIFHNTDAATEYLYKLGGDTNG